jgi:hypothetical protein
MRWLRAMVARWRAHWRWVEAWMAMPTLSLAEIRAVGAAADEAREHISAAEYARWRAEGAAMSERLRAAIASIPDPPARKQDGGH